MKKKLIFEEILKNKLLNKYYPGLIEAHKEKSIMKINLIEDETPYVSSIVSYDQVSDVLKQMLDIDSDKLKAKLNPLSRISTNYLTDNLRNVIIYQVIRSLNK